MAALRAYAWGNACVGAIRIGAAQEMEIWLSSATIAQNSTSLTYNSTKIDPPRLLFHNRTQAYSTTERHSGRKV